MLIDGAKLKEAFNANETSKSVFEYISARQRDRDFVDMVRLRANLIEHGKTVDDQEFTSLWKTIEELGLGVVHSGRNGGSNRFILDFSLKKVAEAAKEGRDFEVKLLQGRTSKHKEAKMSNDTETVTAPAPKKRGRQPGSKSKAKAAQAKSLAAKANALPQPEAELNGQMMTIDIPFNGRKASLALPSDVSSNEIKGIALTISRLFS